MVYGVGVARVIFIRLVIRGDFGASQTGVGGCADHRLMLPSLLLLLPLPLSLSHMSHKLELAHAINTKRENEKERERAACL